MTTQKNLKGSIRGMSYAQRKLGHDKFIYMNGFEYGTDLKSIEEINWIRESLSIFALKIFSKTLEEKIVYRSKIFKLNKIVRYKQIGERRAYSSTTLEKEIIWSLNYLDCNRDAIERYKTLKIALIYSLLSREYEKSLEIIVNIKQDIGLSLFILDIELFIMQELYDIEGQKRISKEINIIAKDSFSAFYAYIISERTEKGFYYDKFKRKMDMSIKAWEIENEYRDYYRYKFAYLIPEDADYISAIVNIEKRASLIDFYETFLLAMRSVNLDVEISASLFGVLEMELVSIFADPVISKLIIDYFDNVLISILNSFEEKENVHIKERSDIAKTIISQRIIPLSDILFSIYHIMHSNNYNEYYQYVRHVKFDYFYLGMIASSPHADEFILRIYDLIKNKNIPDESIIQLISENLYAVLDDRTRILLHKRNEVFNYVKESDIYSATKIVVELVLSDSKLKNCLPVKDIVENNDIKRSKLPKTEIFPLIIYDLYIKEYDDSRVKEKIRWLFEDFLSSHGLRKPSEIVYMRESFPLNELIYFLKEICNHDNLEFCEDLTKSRDVDLERISVCSLLIDLDAQNGDSYREEITELTAKIKVEDGVRLVDQSRIYVNTVAISRWAQWNIKELYDRYIVIADRSITTKNDIINLMSGIIDKDILKYMYVPENEADGLLFKILTDLRDRFLNDSSHGLNSFLSLRIRHGTLPGTFRGGLQKENLLCKYNEKDKKMSDNAYWLDQYSNDNVLGGRINHYLVGFSKKLNDILEDRIKPLFYVKSKENPDGVISISIDELFIAIIKRAVVNYKDLNFDLFLEVVFNAFKTKLIEELKVIRNKLESEVKSAILKLFVDLQDKIYQLGGPETSDIREAIIRAKADTITSLSKINSWLYFEDFKSVDASFDIEQVLDIAKESASRIIKDLNINIAYNIKTKQKLGITMLYEICDIMFIIYENIHKHSMMTNSCEVIIEIFMIDEILYLNTKNEVYFEIDHAKLKEIDDMKRKLESYSSYANREGKSGLAKIKNIISNHRKSSLDFLYKNGRFEMEIGMSMIMIPGSGRDVAEHISS